MCDFYSFTRVAQCKAQKRKTPASLVQGMSLASHHLIEPWDLRLPEISGSRCDLGGDEFDRQALEGQPFVFHIHEDGVTFAKFAPQDRLGDLGF